MNIIKIENLTKIYDKKITAINNISLSINKGDFFAILGKNGAGKSTTIGILTSLIKKTSGKISVYDYDLDKDAENIKSLIGFVSQEYNFNQFEKVLDIILNQAGFYGIKREDALEKAKKYLFFFDLWQKRETIGLNLSGGMKRCLMIIKSIIHDPEIIILDEPTAGVDVIYRRLIWDFLKEINKKGKTIILTTHYLEEVENLCNKVAIIELGKILIETEIEKLLKMIEKKTVIVKIKNGEKIKNINIEGFKMTEKKKDCLEIIIEKNDCLNDLLEKLIKEKIEIQEIKNKNNKLEDLFIDLIYDKK